MSASSTPESSSRPLFSCSIIVPVYNAAPFLHSSLTSILQQESIPLSSLQLIIHDDASTDASPSLLTSLLPTLSSRLGSVLLLTSSSPTPQGCGTSRNKACHHASAPILIFHDADDIMRPKRIRRSLDAFHTPHPCGGTVDVVGGTFDRLPVGSTPRYQRYHNNLTTDELFAHAFRDAPLVMPTIACRRTVWETVGCFVSGYGVPEDLHFLYAAMKHGFNLLKLGPPSLTGYRFHPNMTSLTIHRRTLLDVRVRAFEELVLTKEGWREGFAIWNSGRDGKDVYKRLSEKSKALVTMWGDVSPRKIGKVQNGRAVVHFTQLMPPIACCVVLDREGREFEHNLASLKLRQGIDYVHLV